MTVFAVEMSIFTEAHRNITENPPNTTKTFHIEDTFDRFSIIYSYVIDISIETAINNSFRFVLAMPPDPSVFINKKVFVGT